MNIAIEVPCLWDVHGALAGGAVPGAGAASGVAVEAPLAARALLSLRVVQACLQDEREENFYEQAALRASAHPWEQLTRSEDGRGMGFWGNS